MSWLAPYQQGMGATVYPQVEFARGSSTSSNDSSPESRDYVLLLARRHHRLMTVASVAEAHRAWYLHVWLAMREVDIYSTVDSIPRYLGSSLRET